jgi:TetR/AcrR family transcriptional regulator
VKSNQLEQREEIVHAALRRFSRIGVRKTTLSDIAKDVSLSTSQVQSYYEDKESLMLGCLDYFYMQHMKEAKRISESNLDPMAKLKIYILNRFYAWNEWHNSTSQSLEFVSVVLRMAPEKFVEDEALLEQTLRRILQLGVSSKKLKIAYPEREARMLTICLMSFFPMAGLRNPHPPTEKELLEILDWFGSHWRRK